MSVDYRPLRRTLALGLLLLAVLYVSLGCATYTPSRPTTPGPTTPPPPGQALDVQVADVDGPVLPGAVVTVQDGPNAGRTATANVLGRALLTGLIVPTGQTVCAEAEGYVTACEGVTIITSTNVTIRLAKAAPPAPVRPPTMRGRLTASGRFLRYQDGAVFVWRGATSFALLDLLADGKEAEARARLVEYRDLGFSIVRVLAQADGMFKLAPEAGRAQLSRLCALLTEHDLYAEVVALADSAALQRDAAAIRAQVRAVGQAALACPAFLVQIANENQHVTQHELVRDPVFLSSLAADIPPDVLYTLAPPFDDEAVTPTGEYVTRHRSRSRDPWNQVRRVREIEEVSNQTQRFTVDDEPIGADEQDRPGSRESNCSIFFTQGALARVFEVGSTFHSQDGLFSHAWRPNQRACAEAFIAGTRLVPDDVRLAYKNATWSDSPVKDFNGANAVRVYSGISGNTGIAVALGLTGDPGIVWQNRWRPVRVLAERPGVKVYEVAR